MYRILKRLDLNEKVKLMVIDAPEVAAKAEPGQFIILRVDEYGERIPLTVADFDRDRGSVTIIFQVAGATTAMLAEKREGDFLPTFAGPLGTASHLEGIKKAAVIGGGVGCAIAYPQAKKLHAIGAEVDVIAGFRSKELIILEEQFKNACDRLFLVTDDGSNGHKGFVTDVLKGLIEGGKTYDAVIAIGPLVMMRAVSALTKPYHIKTIVSMNPIMIDGTGMCGGCRLTVSGKTKFACVDGPDFDGHEVDFDEAIRRSHMYAQEERDAMHRYECTLLKGVD
jgi:ferredoxin--NADP+ reductase